MTGFILLFAFIKVAVCLLQLTNVFILNTVFEKIGIIEQVKYLDPILVHEISHPTFIDV